MAQLEKRPVPPQLVGKTWPKGTSGNVYGMSKAVKAVRNLCAKASPEAYQRVLELMRQDDDQGIALAAAKEIMMRGLGKYAEPERLWAAKVAAGEETARMPVLPKDLSDDQLARMLAIAREGQS